ncbi:metallophosphoesterase [Actinomycetaceae bacterium Sa1BUA1]|uniref:Metallophosphoesterase n=1 Tax=Oceanitalea stevensii TaxID=2763072 RepID=A0ABR8Z379_9MICO|nr:metallophosphoesterase [Oceanitalea stevensii]MBD8062786.1 metallophosphoesterase [Oceanitalea stevensii]
MLGKLAGATALTAVGGLGWAVTETRLFTVRTHVVPVLAPGSRPLRVLHVSDLHLTPAQRLKQEWVRRLADLEPDLVVSTGDNLAHQEAVPSVAYALGALLSVPGVFVLGSNDYYAPQPKNPARYLTPSSRRSTTSEEPQTLPTDDLVEVLGSGGWLDLTNTRGSLDVAGQRLSFVGVDDPHLERDRLPAPGGEHGDLHVGVSHAPYTRVLDEMADDGCGLILAGHTHGGQLRVPGYGALVTNCDLDRERASGLHGWPGPRPDAPGGQGSAWLNVSAGMGTSPYTPVRFACRPEVSLLQLVATA